VPDFNALLGRHGCATACFYAFDLLHLGADDLRLLELRERRALLRAQLRKAPPALIYSEHMDGEHGEAMFRHACAMGLEGIISKRVESRYKVRPVLELGEGAKSALCAAVMRREQAMTEVRTPEGVRSQ